MWCFGSVFGQFCWPLDTESQSKMLCSLAHACCDAINSYHLFLLRLRSRSSKLNVAPLLPFLKPQEDLHMQLVLNECSQQLPKKRKSQWLSLFALIRTQETGELSKGTGHTTALHGEENRAWSPLDPSKTHNYSAENLVTENSLQRPNFQPMVQSKVAELQDLTSE